MNGNKWIIIGSRHRRSRARRLNQQRERISGCISSYPHQNK